jgi:7-carboxy-7-deazaguanine synthase
MTTMTSLPIHGADEGAATLRVNETFHSIQGEGLRAGEPCFFIRLSGCPLRCAWCDTAYAFREGSPRTIESLIGQARTIGCPLVQVTGGEPLAQKGCLALVRGLCDAGFTVTIETSGALDIGPLDPRCVRIMDLKCPASGEADRNLWSNIGHLRGCDEVKFVIADRRDYEWARERIRERDLAARVAAVLMSAAWPQPASADIAGSTGLAARELAAWILADRLPVRMQTQLHKVIWDPQTRGV